jgi:hypothetical protein
VSEQFTLLYSALISGGGFGGFVAVVVGVQPTIGGKRDTEVRALVSA